MLLQFGFTPRYAMPPSSPLPPPKSRILIGCAREREREREREQKRYSDVEVASGLHSKEQNMKKGQEIARRVHF